MRVRTTLLATAVSGLALVAGAVFLLLTLDQSLHRSGDDLARGRVHDLAASAQRGALTPELTGIGGEGVGQVFGRDGRVLAASPNIIGRAPITSTSSSSTPFLRVLHDAPDDNQTEDYRVWTMAARAPSGPVTVVVGSSLESVGEASRTLRRDLALGVPLLLLLVASGTWLVVGRTLRPVEDIRSEVASISDEELDRRVPVPGAGDEISRLAITMNQMLDRLEEGSRRQRDFVADASHELQSPLTALRTQLEVALAHDTSDWPATARLMLADTDDMERLVRDLLYLARTYDGVSTSRRELVDLDDVVLEEVARLRGSTEVRLCSEAVSAAPVLGDVDDLRRLVRNVLENAVRHADSEVQVALAAEETAVRLDVVDDGPGIAVEDRDRVFDRFYTSDGSRSRYTGSGLGLAIARQVAEHHSGALRVVGEEAGGAHLELTLPSSGAGRVVNQV